MSKGNKGFKTLGESNRSLNAVPDEENTSTLPRINNKQNNETYNFVNPNKRPPSTKDYLPGINPKDERVYYLKK